MSSNRPLPVPGPSSSVPPEGKNTNGTEKKKKKMDLTLYVPPVLPPCPVAAEEFIQTQTQTQTQRNVVHCDCAVAGRKRPRDSVDCNNEVAAGQKKASNARTIAFQDEDDDDSTVTAFFNLFPKGFKFRPYDDELIEHYLQQKILNRRLAKNRIHAVELYKHNPDELAENYESYGEKEWYFFTPRDRKYQNGTRPSRSAGIGYWKATGPDKNIYGGKKQLIGYKKALVFYVGKAPRGEKTDWIMQEYRAEKKPDTQPAHREPGDMKLDDWVLCKLYKKSGSRSSRVRNRNTQAESITNQVTGDDDDDIDERDSIEDDSTFNNLDSLEPVMASESNFEMSYNGLVNPYFQNETNHYNLAPLPVAIRPPDFACAETFGTGFSLLPFRDNYNPCMFDATNNGQQNHLSLEPISFQPPITMFNPINNGQQSHLSPEPISFQPPVTMSNPINNGQLSHLSPEPVSFQPLVTSDGVNPNKLTSLQYPLSDYTYLNHSNFSWGDEILPNYFSMPPQIEDQFKPPTTREHKSMPPTTEDRSSLLFDEYLAPHFRENQP